MAVLFWTAFGSHDSVSSCIFCPKLPLVSRALARPPKCATCILPRSSAVFYLPCGSTCFLGIFWVFMGNVFGFLGLDGRERITVTRIGLTSRLHLFFFGYFFLVLPSWVLQTLHHSSYILNTPRHLAIPVQKYILNTPPHLAIPEFFACFFASLLPCFVACFLASLLSCLLFALLIPFLPSSFLPSFCLLRSFLPSFLRSFLFAGLIISSPLVMSSFLPSFLVLCCLPSFLFSLT